MLATPANNNGNGKISWTTLISTGSLVFAIVAGGWSLIRAEVSAVKELTDTERKAIAAQLEQNDRVTEALRTTKLDISRFDQTVDRFITVETQRNEILQKQIDALGNRIDRLEHPPK